MGLLKRREDAAKRLDTIGHEIAEAVADGDQKALTRLRSQRAKLRDEVEDLASGAELLAARQREAEEEKRRAKTSAARQRARETADRLSERGASVDQALAALEAEIVAYKDTARLLGRHLNEAGAQDGFRIANRMGDHLRWATYHAAPTFAASVEVPRVPHPRRKPLAKLTGRNVPNLEEQTA
ncbi:MAG: hypothetical protein AAGH41_08990 [Pseudomonadota bacterium]